MDSGVKEWMLSGREMDAGGMNERIDDKWSIMDGG
jgi:hypothetical protein